MTLHDATRLLGKAIQEDGSIKLDYPPFHKMSFNKGEGSASLDGIFVPDELEALAIYMRATAAGDNHQSRDPREAEGSFEPLSG